MKETVYREPHSLPAAFLAVAVHGAFFALLYFGIAWQSQPGETMNVELWQSIPGEEGAAPEQAKAEEAVQPPQPEEAAKPEQVVKPEIELPDKKKEKKPPPVLPPLFEKKPAPIGKIGNIRGAAIKGSAGAQQAGPGTSGQATRSAAGGSVVDEYTAKIRGKIQSLVVVPPNVPDDAQAIFLVTVLPGGSVLPPKLVESSGYPAYDGAVERAILVAQPLPLPPDPALASRFRDLKLVFRPKPERR